MKRKSAPFVLLAGTLALVTFAVVVATLPASMQTVGGGSAAWHGSSVAAPLPAMTVNFTPGSFINGTCSPFSAVVTFNATATLAQRPVNYTWNFGDDSPPAYGENVTHTYDREGLFNVTLLATDARGSTAGVTHSVATYAPGCLPPGAGVQFLGVFVVGLAVATGIAVASLSLLWLGEFRGRAAPRRGRR